MEIMDGNRLHSRDHVDFVDAYIHNQPRLCRYQYFGIFQRLLYSWTTYIHLGKCALQFIFHRRICHDIVQSSLFEDKAILSSRANCVGQMHTAFLHKVSYLISVETLFTFPSTIAVIQLYYLYTPQEVFHSCFY